MAERRFPIWMRVGDGSQEFHVGDITCAPGEDPPSRQLPFILRQVAAEIEQQQAEGDILAALDREAQAALPDELRGDGG